MSGNIKTGNYPIISTDQDGLFNLTQYGKSFIIPRSHSHNRIDPLCLDVLGAPCFSQNDFDHVSIHSTHQYPSLVIVEAHNITAQDLKGQLAQLDDIATLKQVVIPDKYLAFHRGQSNSLKALRNSCNFTLIVSQDTYELLQSPNKHLAVLVPRQDDVLQSMILVQDSSITIINCCSAQYISCITLLEICIFIISQNSNCAERR
jgi:hypothetical protein